MGVESQPFCQNETFFLQRMARRSFDARNPCFMGFPESAGDLSPEGGGERNHPVPKKANPSHLFLPICIEITLIVVNPIDARVQVEGHPRWVAKQLANFKHG